MKGKISLTNLRGIPSNPNALDFIALIAFETEYSSVNVNLKPCSLGIASGGKFYIEI